MYIHFFPIINCSNTVILKIVYILKCFIKPLTGVTVLKVDGHSKVTGLNQTSSLPGLGSCYPSSSESPSCRRRYRCPPALGPPHSYGPIWNERTRTKITVQNMRWYPRSLLALDESWFDWDTVTKLSHEYLYLINKPFYIQVCSNAHIFNQYRWYGEKLSLQENTESQMASGTFQSELALKACCRECLAFQKRSTTLRRSPESHSAFSQREHTAIQSVILHCNQNNNSSVKFTQLDVCCECFSFNAIQQKSRADDVVL